jgi:hypothetical protein
MQNGEPVEGIAIPLSGDDYVGTDLLEVSKLYRLANQIVG